MPPKGAKNPFLMFWGLLMVGASSMLGSLIGLGLGSAIGLAFPGYYRAVLLNGDAPNFDPLAVGAGLGLTQGFVGGAVIGILIVGLYFWLAFRPSHPEAGIVKG